MICITYALEHCLEYPNVHELRIKLPALSAYLAVGFEICPVNFHDMHLVRFKLAKAKPTSGTVPNC